MKRLAFVLAFVSVFMVGLDVKARNCAVANGDAKSVDDVTTTSGSGAIVSASAPFLCPGDVGKTIVISNAGSLVTATTTIAVCTDTSHVTTVATAGASTTNSIAIWATGDSTAAINTQVTACKTAAGSTFSVDQKFFGGDVGNVTLSGGYLISGCIYNVAKVGAIPSMFGGGSQGTVLFISPDTWTNCAAGPFLFHASGQGVTLAGLTIEGGGRKFAGNQNLVNFVQVGRIRIDDVQILNVGGDTNGTGALSIASGDDTYIRQTKVQNAPSGDRSYACLLGTTGSSDNLVCSNHFRGVLVNNGNGRTPVSTQFTMRNGMIDECGDPQLWCTYVADNAQFQSNGTTFFSTVHVGTNSTAYITNGNVGKFNSADRVVGMDINSGAKVFLSGTTVRGNAGAKSVVNRGSVIDMLGNDFPTCTSITCTARNASQAFTGALPVRR